VETAAVNASVFFAGPNNGNRELFTDRSINGQSADNERSIRCCFSVSPDWRSWSGGLDFLLEEFDSLRISVPHPLRLREPRRGVRTLIIFSWDFRIS